MAKKEFLETSLVQKVILLKHGDRTGGTKSTALGLRGERLIIYSGAGGGKVKGKFPKEFSYAKENSGDTGSLAIVKLRLFFPLAKH